MDNVLLKVIFIDGLCWVILEIEKEIDSELVSGFVYEYD